MRIKASTPTWRIVLHATTNLVVLLTCLYCIAEEHWRLAAVTGLITLIAVIEGARDRILDQMELRR